MKKSVMIIAALAVSFGSYAQDAQSAAQNAQSVAQAAVEAISDAANAAVPVEKPNYWTRSITFDLGFNETGIWNWAEGGYPTLTLGASIDAKADYARDMMTWKNRLQLNYGFLWSEDKRELIQKNTDRIYLESKWGYKTGSNSKWSYSAAYDFRTQFSNTYDNYQKDERGRWFGDLKSGFLAPAYTNLALGMDWNPANWFSMSLSPLTGGFTICTIDALRSTYGMKPYDPDDPDKGYHSALFQFGAQLKANAKASVNDKFTFETQLVLFYDYLNKPTFTKFPVRVNWDNKISWLVTQRFKVGLNTWLIYDPNVKFAIPGVEDGYTDKVQFKEFLTINFTYTLGGKK